jgi:hypothetical protein
MTSLSPAALAVWEAFNSEEPGVFVDYGDCLAAALRAAADQMGCYQSKKFLYSIADAMKLRNIAAELEGQ